MKKVLFILAATVVLIFVGYLRFNGLTSNPPSLFSDEVDGGYQAFVFNRCKNDYFGNKWPVNFHSYSDWRTPLFIYWVAVSEKIFGVTDWAVRLPMALAVFMVPIFLGLIIYELFNNRWLGLLGTFLGGINPWLYHYGRAGWEADGMILALTAAIYFWLVYLRKKKFWLLAVSMICWIGSFYFYSTAKLFILLILVPIILIWFKDIFSNKRFLAAVLLLGLILSVPMMRDTANGRSGYRFSYISIFSDPTIHDNVDRARYTDASSIYTPGTIGVSPSMESKIVHNKAEEMSMKFVTNYFASLSTEFLFLKGDGNLRQGFGERGNFYFIDLVFMAVGIGWALGQGLMNKKEDKDGLNKFNIFMIWFLVLSPIPYALTRDSDFVSSTRVLTMIIPLQYFIVLGIWKLWQSIKWHQNLKMGGAALAALIYLICAVDFFHYYQYHYPQISARSWHYGIKEAVLATKNLTDKKVYYSSTYEPFLPFFYFYDQYLPSSNDCNPAKNTVWDNNDFFTGRQIENHYYFGYIEWSRIFNENLDWDKLVFVIPEDELVRAKTTLNDNIQAKKSMEIKVSYEIPKKYREQTKLYVVNIAKNTDSI